MTDLTQPIGQRPRFERTPLHKFFAIVTLILFADWLFYGHVAGVSFVLFLLALELGVCVANPVGIERGALGNAGMIFALALLPFVEEPGFFAFLFAVMGAAYFALTLAAPTRDRAEMRLVASLCLLAAGLWRGVYDICRAIENWVRGDTPFIRPAAFVVWVVPLALGAIFVALFASANPLIEAWIEAIDPGKALANVNFLRLAFWFVVTMLVWPFVAMRVPRAVKTAIVATVDPPPAAPALIVFGTAAILRSLILFDVLFAVQTVLDMLYLWGGVALPNGMSYAAYAHRGAYPLIATALLAAAFVIAAMRPGSERARSPLIRALVFLWTAQNVLLVISSILRLDLYVQVYSLTYWRVSAFVWMVLVALGLVLIVARIILDRPTGWLVRMNLLTLSLALYLCSLTNFDGIIANYNVAHSRELSGQGVPLDAFYLQSLGPQALPAMDRFLAHGRSKYSVPLAEGRERLFAENLKSLDDWRAWSFRGWRLRRYLSQTSL